MISLKIFLLHVYYYNNNNSNSNSNNNSRNNSSLDEDNFKVIAIVDSGSSGSRLFCYSVNENSANDIFIAAESVSLMVGPFEIKPGLNSVPQKEIKEYLMGLLDKALHALPGKNAKIHEFYWFSTAGMRLLPRSEAEQKLNSICHLLTLKENIDFTMDQCSQNVRIISGVEEGVFGWLSVANISQLREFDWVEQQSLGFIDLGGASLQVVFPKAPTATKDENYSSKYSQLISFHDLFHKNAFNSSSFDEAVSVYQVQLKSIKSFTLFAKSYLGFGVNEIHRIYNSKFLHSSDESNDPCQSNFYICLERTRSLLRSKTCPALNEMNLISKNDASTQQCRISKDENGQDLESIPQQWIGASEIYHIQRSISKIIKEENNPSPPSIPFSEKVKYCSGASSVLSSENETEKFICFKAAWISAILQDGLGITDEHTLQSSNQTWTLGAVYYILLGHKDNDENS